jgi:hypothetical protein
MAVHHDRNDTYWLQVYVNGIWTTDRKVTKQGGSNTARASARRTGRSYRVYNLTKGAVYVECKP